MSEERRSDDDFEVDELLPWVEFGCWTAIVLFPFLYYVNGPAVSADQFVVRTILVILAVTGVITPRIRNWQARKKNTKRISTCEPPTIDLSASNPGHPSELPAGDRQSATRLD